MSYTLVLEWMPGDLYMSAVTARCTAPTSSYSVVWLPPNKVYQITLYCGSTSLVSFPVGAFRGKAWSYMTQYLYPQNLKATANLWLWGLRDFTILCIAALLSVVALVQLHFFIPAAATLCYGFLTIRMDDTTVLDFIKYAVRYFISTQQYFEWR